MGKVIRGERDGEVWGAAEQATAASSALLPGSSATCPEVPLINQSNPI